MRQEETAEWDEVGRMEDGNKGGGTEGKGKRERGTVREKGGKSEPIL